jgi:lipid-A-disaccharide synthase
MVAGDASGDLLGARLIASLHERRPGLRIVGLAGRRMQAQGAESYVAIDKLPVQGSGRWLLCKRELRRFRSRLIEQLLDARPAMVIGIGAPEFNLEIERRLKGVGVKTLQYVGPPVWAWRRWRVRRIARALDRVLTLFPFETAIYEQAAIPVTFVGHPLADSVPLDVDKAAARTQLRLPHGRLIVTLMPGNLPNAHHDLAEVLVKAARRFYNEVKEVHFVVPAASREHRERFETTLRLHADGDFPLTVLFGHAHEALAAADLALVSSGTDALEAALFKTPMVIAHRTTAPSGWLARWPSSSRPWIGLPNLLAGAPVVPEYVQRQATPWGLAAGLMTLMSDAQARKRQIEQFREIHQMLRQDHAQKVSDAVLGMLGDDAG